MTKKYTRKAPHERLTQHAPHERKKSVIALAVFAVLAAISSPRIAFAFPLNFDNPELSGDFNTTISYTTAYRLRPADSQLIFGPSTTYNFNQDDGDTNFYHRGFVENRVDAFSELDLKYQSYGIRVSAKAYYDAMYNQQNANDSPASTNNISVPYNHFTDATQTASGRQAELMDAFVFGTHNIGGVPVTVRVGQLAQEYGETLFFGSNGIAGGMAPVDVNALVSSPSTEFKDVILPEPQATLSVQLPYRITFGAYYQFGWRSDQLPPVGSYFSTGDVVGQGAESFYLPIPGYPPLLMRAADQVGANTGQYGFQLKFSPSGWNTDFGLYAIRYNAKDPELYLNPASGTYRATYPNGIRVFGASFSTNLGDANVAGEASVRHNMPLTSDPVLDFAGVGNNTSNPLYAIGNTAHANLSVLYSLPHTPLWQDASLSAEVGWNRLLSITSNPQALDPGTTRDAIGFKIVFTPDYYQVLPGLDIGVPIGIGYNPYGRSSVVGFNGGGYHTGSFTLGVNGTYQQVWKFALNYTRYLGPTAPYIAASNVYSFGQSLADRDFIALSISRSF